MHAVTNPLLMCSPQALDLPDFALLRPAHFAPALQVAMQQHRDEVAAIVGDDAPASFDNTAAALDRSGERLLRIEFVLSNLSASATSTELQAVQRELAAPLAAHASAVLQDPGLFRRLDSLLRQQPDDSLSAEQQRLVQRLHSDMRRAGAQLPEPARTEFSALAQQHAQLTTRFAQNVLQAEAGFTLALADEASLAGLPEFLCAAARQAGLDRGLATPVVTLSRSLLVPFLSFSQRRDLREQVWRAWVGRGEQEGDLDNRAVVSQILALRQRQAKLMGHDNYADFKLIDTMAGSRSRVWALLDEVWQRALPALAGERALLQQAMQAAGADHALQPWDWRYWAEQVRQQHFALDEAEVKPYFSLPAMVAAAFDCAQRLFGLRFVPRADLLAYHPDVKVYEVRGEEGQTIGLFLQDNFSRPAKRSGAWMSVLQLQHRNGPAGQMQQLPVVLNNNNFAKAAEGSPTLLSPDDVRTLFHEFGHGLHGLLSDVGYRRLSGTRVLRDFVELPSQLFEHWGTEPEVLRRHARHWQTGQPMPDALLQRLHAARRFGQGYETVRYTASAIVDLAAHETPAPLDDIEAFEQAVMAGRGLPPEAGMNHRLPQFQHLFAGDSYAAGYYVYLWAEVLEADAFDAFVEAGNAFDPELAARLKACIYSRGDSVEPGQAFRNFRGRDPVITPMLRDRGLVP